MHQRIAHIALVVKDYDEAAKECALLLAKAANDEQAQSIGNQTGGRVFLFLFTDNFERDYQRYQEIGIHFVRPPQDFEYGRVAVFEDLYGNMWDLLEPNSNNKGYIRPA